MAQPPGSHPTCHQLDIDIAVQDGRVLTESCAGVGATPEEALANGFSKFSSSALHVLLSAFHGLRDEAQVDIEEWSICGEPWRAHVGPLCRMATQGPTPGPPEGLLECVQACLQGARLLARPHWLRIFRAELAGEPSTLEVLLDNATWHDGARRLAELSWPSAPGYSSVRLFMAFEPPSGSTASFLSERESIERGMDLLLGLAEQEPEASDQCWFQSLTAANVAPDAAERLIAFAPIAFGEVLLSAATHPDEYQLMCGHKPGPALPLASEPAYVAASRAAVSMADKARRNAAFRTLALRSATVHVANQLLHAGSKLEDLGFTPSVVLLGRFSAPALAPAVTPPPSEPARPRPWWKVW